MTQVVVKSWRKSVGKFIRRRYSCEKKILANFILFREKVIPFQLFLSRKKYLYINVGNVIRSSLLFLPDYE